jgi:membrane protein
VSWKAGLIAGFVVGIMYAIWQWIYVTFQVNASSYGAIYGSFAAVPLFLIWLNYSWLIILFGTELSRSIQEINKHS